MDTRITAREIVEGSIVLLKNEGGLLPLGKGSVAFFGRAQLDTIISGSGSGAARGSERLCILDECAKLGLVSPPVLEGFYREALKPAEGEGQAAGFDFEKFMELIHSGVIYEIFGKYTPPAEEVELSDELVRESAQAADTAVLVLGRASGGEECDRHLYDDYYLTPSEKRLVAQVCAAFERVVLVLNINGLIDLEWLESYPSIKSVLFLGIPGEQGPAALARILTGEVAPSGKLPVSIARRYEDYPTHRDFSWDKDAPLVYADYGLNAEENGSAGFDRSPVTLYREGLYLGYRYFTSFGVEPLFPFGSGLGYTTFDIHTLKAEKRDGKLAVTVEVRNTGAREGREVVQLYVSAINTASEHVERELKGFAKTRLLAPGESETLTVTMPLDELACYVEATACHTIERGSYLLRVGSSSKDTALVGRVDVSEDIVTERCSNRLVMKRYNSDRIDRLHRGTATVELPDVPAMTLSAAEVPVKAAPAARPNERLDDLSLDELMALCVGYGPGTPFGGFAGGSDPNTIFDESGQPVTTSDHPTGTNGYISPAIVGHGIHSVSYKDGPAGVGHIAWPGEMLIACSFDRDLCERFGDAVGGEAEGDKVDLWLAPAVNLHRHPLGGRNFEYLSEDPLLSGVLACAIADGVRKNHPVRVCAKHFALNEQETYRRGSGKKSIDATDSVVDERVARELYLKPFEMLVRNSELRCIMSSFNKINGTFAGGSYDLNTAILRGEWGFDGAVVTDWGDMDVVVDGADAVAAGNDIVMPGGPPVIAQIRRGYEEGRVTREQLETAVSHLISMLRVFGRYDG